MGASEKEDVFELCDEELKRRYNEAFDGVRNAGSLTPWSDVITQRTGERIARLTHWLVRATVVMAVATLVLALGTVWTIVAD